MNDEAPNTPSENEAPTDEPKEERSTRTARKSTKKVVSRVRDAKTKSGPRDDSDNGSDSEGSQRRGSDSSEDAPQEIPMVMEDAPRDSKSNSGREERRRPSRGRRSGSAKPASPSRTLEPVDPEELSKRAWRIYQADVAEEGITLIDNSTGRQLALRSFELARVFLEEQGRQVKLCKASKESKRDNSSRSERRSEESNDDERSGDEDDES